MNNEETLAMLEHEIQVAGFTPYRIGKGWYEYDDLFLYGDYRGSVVQQTNIRALREDYVPPLDIPVLHGNEDEILLEMTEGKCPIIILALSYYTEKVIFNMAKIADDYPDLYCALIELGNYPCLDDELINVVEEERIASAWEFACDDILHDVYDNSPDKELVDYTTWKDRVTNKYNETELLNIWLVDENGENYGSDYITHETGPSVHFRRTAYRKNESEMLTTPMERLINMTKLYTEDEGAKVMAQNPKTTPA